MREIRYLGTLADRVLAVVAPKVTAHANCCPIEDSTVPCGCISGTKWERTCLDNCCRITCYPCYNTGVSC